VRAWVAKRALTVPMGTALLTGADEEIWLSCGAAASTTLPQV
jgi:hypothetical protein